MNYKYNIILISRRTEIYEYKFGKNRNRHQRYINTKSGVIDYYYLVKPKMRLQDPFLCDISPKKKFLF